MNKITLSPAELLIHGADCPLCGGDLFYMIHINELRCDHCNQMLSADSIDKGHKLHALVTGKLSRLTLSV